MSCLSLALGVFQKPEADPLAKTNTYLTIAWNYRVSKNNKTLPAFNIRILCDIYSQHLQAAHTSGQSLITSLLKSTKLSVNSKSVWCEASCGLDQSYC